MAKKDKKQKEKIHRNRHHTAPTSRFQKIKDPSVHAAWHHLFYNLTTEEAKRVVREWDDGSGNIKDTIYQSKKEDLIKVFGETKKVKRILQIIDRHWRFYGMLIVPIPEELRQKKNLFEIEVIHLDSNNIKIILIPLKEKG